MTWLEWLDLNVSWLEWLDFNDSAWMTWLEWLDETLSPTPAMHQSDKQVWDESLATIPGKGVVDDVGSLAK